MHIPQTKIKEEIIETSTLRNQFKGIVKLIHKNKEGNILGVKVFPFKSFVANFARVLAGNLLEVDNNTTSTESYMKIKDADNTALTNSCFSMNVLEGAMPDTPLYGIQVGNTLTTDSYFNSDMLGTIADTDYDMRNMYDGLVDSLVSYSATTSTLSSNTITITRRIENVSASSIQIDEVGLFQKFIDSGATSKYIMIARDIIEPITIVAGDLVDISYSLSVTSESSFTSQFLGMLQSMLAGTSTTVRDTTGTTTSKDFDDTSRVISLMALATDDDYGLIVGATDREPNPQSYTSYSLTNHKISHSGSGLSYGAVSAVSLTYDSSIGAMRFGIKRDFENLSSLPITIGEIGVVGKHIATSSYYLLQRVTTNKVIEAGKIYRCTVSMEFPIMNIAS